MCTSNGGSQGSCSHGDKLVTVEIEAKTSVDQDDPGSGRLEAVRRATKTWTGQLVDLTGRNNLLYYRDLKVGSLPLDSAPRQLIYRALTGHPVLLSRLFVDEEGREDAFKRARAVRNKANAHFEERGIETLYLACGMATWNAQKSAATPAAPVLLVPVRLAPRGAAQNEFELTVTGELEVNPTFLQMLKAEFDVDCDPVELLESAGIEGIIDTPEELETSFSWLRQQCSTVPGFAIADRFVIGNFSYARMPMVRDLENAIEAMAEHDIIAALAGDEEAQAALRERGTTTSIPSPDFIPPADEFLVLDADASQNYAINAVLTGRDLIIKGPPGTGKSQTISNLISTLVARGKRVLFVAEKRAAIDAVLHRLDNVDLGDIVLDLHGGVSSKRKVAAALNEALGRNASLAKPEVEGLHRLLSQRREQLNAHVEALHETRAPWETSYFEAHLRLLDLPEAAHNPIRFRDEVLQSFGREQLTQATETLQDYVGKGGLMLRHSGSPWARAVVVSEEEASERRAEAAGLRRRLPQVLDNLNRAAAATDLRSPGTLEEWAALVQLWRRVEQTYATWTDGVFRLHLEQTIAAAAPLGESATARVSATLIDGEYRVAKKTLRGALREGVKLSPGELHQAAEAALDVRQACITAGLGPQAPPAFPAELDALQASFEETCFQLNTLANHLGRKMASDIEDVLAELDALLADIPTLAKLPELHRLRQTLEASLLGELLESIDAQPLNRSEAADALSFAWHASLIEHLQLSDSRLGSFDGSQHDELVSEFQEADREHIETTPQRVRRLCAEQAVQAEDTAPEDARLIRAEANKKRKHLATRQLFSAAPEMMMAIKPCWAMSPLVVSQVLPSDRPYFDVVIFDEASQIRPAEAMTSILRGKQLVVAGDEHQLPPTSFFSSTNPEVEDDDSEVDHLAVDGSYESILEALAAFIDFRMLAWHYRSRDERLINFSNVHVYDRGLTTFPGVVGPNCVGHVLVPHVPGEVGGELSAVAEVEKVVELILAHARQHPDQSLGVITMGIKHAERIEEARRQALEDDDEELAEFFDESRPEPFFVKNLERVQGDERDAIILAVGYGKNADGRLLYRFGPLNMEGGERRLNVAVSRAKERMTLVSSFDHRDMDPERSTARGVELLHSYLEYCTSNGTRLGDTDATKPELNPFEVDVRNNLERAGIPLDPQHGCSGYRIDFAAKHPKRPGQMVLAIECDGATYHSSQSARDRDRLRQEHLERLGWRFHRIWSQDWFANKQAEVERAKAAFEAATRAEDGIDAQAERVSGESDEENVAGPAGEKSPPNAEGNGLRARTGCPIRTGRDGIDQYSPAELAALIKWIEADTLLRTKEQLIDAAIRKLGFQKRGSRIVSALEGAIELARNGSCSN